MKRSFIFVIALFLTCTSLDVAAMELPDFAALAKRCGPAVVNISTSQTKTMLGRGGNAFNMPDIPNDGAMQDLLRRFFGDQDEVPDDTPSSRSLGSGFFVSKDGYILTNYHVVKDADEIIVRTSDRREFKAKVIGSDRRSDTALIKVDIKDAPLIEIGSSKDLEVGDWVLAIGSPFGFDHSVTQGIISALDRSLPSENYVPFIQTDVAINPGNSGGPLIDLQGRVIGINSQIYSRTGGFMGLSFAVPIDLAKNVIEQLKNRGRVSRGWLGVMIQDVTKDLAETFGMPNPKGALVAKVLKGSPADKAGLQVGDIIISFNGNDLPTSSVLPPMVGTSSVDAPSTLHILRNGKEQTVKILIGELPEDEGQPQLGATTAPKEVAPTNRLGLVVRDLTAEERKDLGLKRGEGAVVDRVSKGTAKEAGLQPGDVVLMFNNTPIQEGAAQLREKIESLADKRSVAILIQRGDERMFIAMLL